MMQNDLESIFNVGQNHFWKIYLQYVYNEAVAVGFLRNTYSTISEKLPTLGFGFSRKVSHKKFSSLVLFLNCI